MRIFQCEKIGCDAVFKEDKASHAIICGKILRFCSESHRTIYRRQVTQLMKVEPDAR